MDHVLSGQSQSGNRAAARRRQWPGLHSATPDPALAADCDPVQRRRLTGRLRGRGRKAAEFRDIADVCPKTDLSARRLLFTEAVGARTGHRWPAMPICGAQTAEERPVDGHHCAVRVWLTRERPGPDRSGSVTATHGDSLPCFRDVGATDRGAGTRPLSLLPVSLTRKHCSFQRHSFRTRSSGEGTVYESARLAAAERFPFPGLLLGRRRRRTYRQEARMGLAGNPGRPPLTARSGHRGVLALGF